jgi:hypothetical protein
LLSSGEDATTDLQANLDWSKLAWNIDGNGAQIAFSQSDIASAKVTNDTTLTIVLGGSTKAVDLEDTGNYDNLTTDDTVAITSGFAIDAAGNTSTTDAYTGPSYNIVVFDLVNGNSSSHSNRSFDADTNYAIYIRVDSDSMDLKVDSSGGSEEASWGVWTNAHNLDSNDRIILAGNGTAVQAVAGNEVVYSVYNSRRHYWDSVGSSAGVLQDDGDFSRVFLGNTGEADLWTGNWVENPNTGDNNVNFVNSVPNSILICQGLI